MPNTDPQLEPTMTPLLHTISGVQERLGGISRTSVYRLLGSGDLRSVHIGKRRLITEDELRRYVATLTADALT